jgi:hypothetical protein
MIIIWWSKHVGVILSVLMCDIWINVLLQTSALVGPLHIENIVVTVWAQCLNSVSTVCAQCECEHSVCTAWAQCEHRVCTVCARYLWRQSQFLLNTLQHCANSINTTDLDLNRVHNSNLHRSVQRLHKQLWHIYNAQFGVESPSTQQCVFLSDKLQDYMFRSQNM